MSLRIVAILSLLTVCAVAQNVVVDSRTKQILPALKGDVRRAEKLLSRPPTSSLVNQTPTAAQTTAKLVAHVEALVRGWPWRPFHCTLGISGSETYFAHPDELFYSLGLALPFLPETLRSDVGKLLARELEQTPPYAAEGFDEAEGHARERYEVPENLRKRGRGTASSLFGVAALSAYLDSLSAERSTELLNAHWERVKHRVRPSLEERFIADLEKAGSAGIDAEKLNGDLAGLIAFARFAKIRGEADTTQAALRGIDRLARLRIDLERTNPQLLAPATSATKRLHNFKLARFDHLVPAVSALFIDEERALAAARLKEFREGRPGWWLAFGDRFVGGENYISPPHLSHAMFTGAALVESIDAATLAEWIDLPWCEADLFFIEKCAIALTSK